MKLYKIVKHSAGSLLEACVILRLSRFTILNNDRLMFPSSYRDSLVLSCGYFPQTCSFWYIPRNGKAKELVSCKEVGEWLFLRQILNRGCSAWDGRR